MANTHVTSVIEMMLRARILVAQLTAMNVILNGDDFAIRAAPLNVLFSWHYKQQIATKRRQYKIVSSMRFSGSSSLLLPIVFFWCRSCLRILQMWRCVLTGSFQTCPNRQCLFSVAFNTLCKWSWAGTLIIASNIWFMSCCSLGWWFQLKRLRWRFSEWQSAFWIDVSRKFHALSMAQWCQGNILSF